MSNGDVIAEYAHKSGLFSLHFGASAEQAKSTLLYLHGFPGSGLEGVLLHKEACAAGVQVIALDRPGFGRSLNVDPLSIGAAGALAAEAMQELSILQYSIVGVSGGGPHALATALAAPHAVKRIVIVSGLGDLHMPGALTGMLTQNKLILKVAKISPWLCRPIVRMIANGWRDSPHAMIRFMARMLTGDDREILRDDDFARPFAVSMQRGVSLGFQGGLRELARISQKWELTLGSITCPVDIFHGDQDIYVPFSHGQWLADQIKGSRLHVKKGQGHFMVARMAQEILDTVLS